MTVNLQNRLKNLFEFEFADDAVDEKSLQAFTLTEEESGFLNRAIKTQSDAEEARARGDIANALLLADGSALIVSAIHARYMCAK